MKEFVLESRNQETRQNAKLRGNPLPPALGVIEVIHVVSRGTSVTRRKGVLTVVPVENCRDLLPLTMKIREEWPNLMMMCWWLCPRINGFIVKRVLVD